MLKRNQRELQAQSFPFTDKGTEAQTLQRAGAESRATLAPRRWTASVATSHLEEATSSSSFCPRPCPSAKRTCTHEADGANGGSPGADKGAVGGRRTRGRGPALGRAESQPCCRHGKRKNREPASKGWTMWQGPCSGRWPLT